MTFNLMHYKHAAFPAVCIETVEEERILKYVRDMQDSNVYSISATGGLWDVHKNELTDKSADYRKAFSYVANLESAILVVFDYQHIVRNAGGYRALKNCFADLKDKGSMIALIAPFWQLPAELSHDVPILQFDLPTRDQLKSALDIVSSGAEVKVTEEDKLLDASAGLALQEAENALALSLVEKQKFDASTVEREKMRLVKSSGFLEVTTPVSPSEVGGLVNLKKYIKNEVVPSWHDNLLRVRGVMMVGVPGTGKSLTAKACGAILGCPVLKMDISALKGSLVGQSESNLRQALKLADAVAPCILYIDEIEKGVGGYASSANSDGGTTLAMVGSLLNWMQEHTTSVIVLATCNDYSKLPAELTRAGRFDERFFVDLPSLSERESIATIHLKKYASASNAFAVSIADMTNEWTGAEIEQLIKSAARQTGRNITKEALEAASAEIKPISRVRADEISKLRDWAKSTLRLANTVEAKAEKTRKVMVQ